MKLYEYQAKNLLKELGLNVVAGKIAYTVKEACKIAKDLGGEKFLIKAQSNRLGTNSYMSRLKDNKRIPSIVSVCSGEELAEYVEFMLGNSLIVAQTEEVDKEELEIHKVYIEKQYDIEKTMYLNLMLDAKEEALTIITGKHNSLGEVDKLHYEQLTTWQRPNIRVFRNVFKSLDLEEHYLNQIKNHVKLLYKALFKYDALKIEVKELILTRTGEILIKEIDIFFDDYGISRQKELFNMVDKSELAKEEEFAYRWNVRYIPFKGNISVMTNGVGLGLALADMIHLKGGELAHIIDIGWNANQTRIAKAFQLILSNVDVDGLLIYVYGGSLHCDEVARGIITAVKDISLEIPLVVRLGGTNQEKAKELLKASQLPIKISEDMSSSSEMIVEMVGKDI